VFIRDGRVIATNRRRRWKFADVYDIDASADNRAGVGPTPAAGHHGRMDALQAR